MNGLTIRDACWPQDEWAAVSFIDGLQKFEHQFEPNRRIDPQVGHDYFAILMGRVAESEGRVFIAEDQVGPVGWAVFLVEKDAVYIVEKERRVGYVAELFVKEDARGTGAGKLLLEACELEARSRNLKVLMIGVLGKNTRARTVYLAAGFGAYSEDLRKYL
jgi:GNAT superfamily N-acetyltransferase